MFSARVLSVLLLLSLALPAIHVAAQAPPRVPDTLSFQGVLTDGAGIPLNTTVSMRVRLYEGATLKTTLLNGPVNIVNGRYEVLMPTDDTFAFDRPLNLGIKVGADAEMTKRIPLTAAPYALGLRGLYVRRAVFDEYEAYNVVGGLGNSVSAGVVGATISGGGRYNFVSHFSHPNAVGGNYGTIGGGYSNVANVNATVGGGNDNSASGSRSTISGGSSHMASGPYSTIGGGDNNWALGTHSTIPGGYKNRTTRGYSFAAGYRAKADHSGAFVWADSVSTVTDFVSTGANQFLIRASGGVGIGTNNPGSNQLRVNSSTTGGINTATLDVENFGTGNGIAAHFESNGTDATLVIDQDGSGDHIKTFANGILRFAVRDNGNVNADGTFSSPASDLAEWFEVENGSSDYEPGDVLTISDDHDRTLRKSSSPYSTSIAGVYATKPGVLLGESVEGYSVPVGVVGVLPTKVSGENGPIRRGDLLASSSTTGHAMRAKPRVVEGMELYPTGSIIGKALESFDGPGLGVIEVLVMPR